MKSGILRGMNTMLTQSELRSLILARGTSFAVGVRGVIAEFHWADGDSIEFDDGALALATTRGALAIRLRGGERLQEISAADDHDASHGHAPDDAHARGEALSARVCWLPASEAVLASQRGLTDLGCDHGAVRPEHHSERLFDMGFGLGHVRACVRTGDERLAGVLREHQGEDILEHDHPAMRAIKEQGPHRVFESASARIEVYQPIPSRARGERTPAGPHTHVLPRLLGSADPMLAALPDQARPVFTLYNAH